MLCPFHHVHLLNSTSGRVDLPTRMALCIAVLQLSQMFVGLYVNVQAYWIKKTSDPTCSIHQEHFYIMAMVMYS